MKTNHLKLALAALCALCAPAFSACTPDTGIEVTTVKRTSDVSIKRSTINRADLEMSAANWKPVSAAEQTILPRNPFRGYTDTIMAENLRRLRAMEEQREADVLLPEQVYPTRDYKVISVITGTADPKVFVVDPAGNRFVLRRGSLIGNNNGSISSIRREGIEVYERIADKGQYIELPLFDKPTNDRSKIQIKLN